MTSPYIESLPDDLLSEILVRLPADDLHDRARLVCRRWSHIISSVAFANTHLHHSSYGLVLSAHGRSHPIYVSATKQGQIEVSRLSCKCITIASCNGLLLEFPPRGITSLHILNPATKKAFLLPEIESKSLSRYRLCGVAYGATSMEYKVVQMHVDRHRPHTLHLAILTVGVDNSWRQLQVEHLPDNLRPLFHCTRVVAERFVYWASMHCREILTLDMETEIITETSVPLPACASIEKFFYLSTGRNLSLLFRRRDSTWEVWEMKPEAGEWRKCTHFQFSFEQIDDHELFWPCGWVKYPEVLACHTGIASTLIFYNLRTHEIDPTQVHGHIVGIQPFPHRNTLLWLS